MDGQLAPAAPRRLTTGTPAQAPAGLAVELYWMPAGTVEAPPTARHLVSMHCGAPVRAWCRCEGAAQSRLQSAGDLDIVPAGAGGVWRDESNATILLVQLEPELLRRTAAELNLNPDRVDLYPRLQLRDPRIEHLGWALKAEREDNYAGGALYAESLGTALAAQLLRAHSRSLPALPAAGGLPPRRLRRVLDFMESNLGRNIALAELAAESGYGVSQFKLLFRRSTGLPPHQYLLRRRVERARDLLLHGRLDASRIALDTGFAHQSHMARCMRRLLGVTPSALRREAG